MNLTELLDQSAARWPHKPAIIEDATVISYAALVQKVNELAGRLAAARVAPGQRVGLALPNGIHYVVFTYALWRVGAVVVPIAAECPPEEVAEIREAMQLDALLELKPRIAPVSSLASSGGEGRGEGASGSQTQHPSPQPSPHSRGARETEIAAGGASVALAADCHLTKLQPFQPVDNHGLNLAFIRFTSGTTNARKGVALAHETIRDRVASANQAFGIGPEDTVIWCLPMAHHFLITIVLYLGAGATIVLSRHVVAKPFLEAVNQHHGTVLYAAPFHFAMLARDNSGAQIPSVRLAVSTTCALPQNVSDDFAKRFDRPLVQALGIIELGLVSLNKEDPRGRWNSVGRAAGDFRVRIVNPDENGCGDVAVAGPGIFDAYVAPWIAREQVLREGWFFTGDIGRMDADGFLFLLSRKTAVINLAGRKVFPEEIEAVLNRHPAVRESRVYGKPHAHLGEVVEAELVLDPPGASLDSVRAFCREHLAAYKIPMRFAVVNALPRTPVTGKILRAAPVA